MLGDLGVSKWDTNPPEEGKTRWYDSADQLLADADYKVVLRWSGSSREKISLLKVDFLLPSSAATERRA